MGASDVARAALLDRPSCTLRCPASVNEHVHFPDGFATFVQRVARDVAALKPLPPAPDPAVEAMARWAAAFETARTALTSGGVADEAAVLKAADIAAAAVGLRLG